jgi:hypothetical protein
VFEEMVEIPAKPFPSEMLCPGAKYKWHNLEKKGSFQAACKLFGEQFACNVITATQVTHDFIRSHAHH